MRVPSVNGSYTNNNQKSQNFKGEFLVNAELKSFMKVSRYENLVRFKQLLEKMKKVNDDFVYVVEKKVYTNIVHSDWLCDEDEVVPDVGYEFSRHKKGDINTREWLLGIEQSCWMEPTLGEINDKLELLYPQRAGKKTREKITNELLDLMA